MKPLLVIILLSLLLLSSQTQPIETKESSITPALDVGQHKIDEHAVDAYKNKTNKPHKRIIHDKCDTGHEATHSIDPTDPIFWLRIVSFAKCFTKVF